jgi:hypothetical protein
MPKPNPARQWMRASSKSSKPSVPEKIKTDLETQAAKLVEEVLTPKYIQPPPAEPRFNYPVKVWTKWNKCFFYFTSTWACPFPDAIEPTFEAPFARLEYTAAGRFNLAYFRHTGKWFEIFQGLTIGECLKLISEDGPFTLV